MWCVGCDDGFDGFGILSAATVLSRTFSMSLGRKVVSSLSSFEDVFFFLVRRSRFLSGLSLIERWWCSSRFLCQDLVSGRSWDSFPSSWWRSQENDSIDCCCGVRPFYYHVVLQLSPTTILQWIRPLPFTYADVITSLLPSLNVSFHILPYVF